MSVPEPARGPDQDEERALARLERARPTSAAVHGALHAAARAAALSEAAATRDTSLSERQRLALAFDTWRAVHMLVHRSPHRDDPALARSRQWDRVRLLYEGVGQPELDAWIGLQVEVARNRERGLPDHRPRRDGPTFLVLLEHVANRKRKAHALLRWAIAAEAGGI